MVNRGDALLRGYDEALRDRLLQISITKGIEFRFNTNFEYIEKADGGRFKVKLSGCEEETVDCVMLAVGRRPNVEGLGLETAGVELGERGEIKVDRFSKTNLDHIYAVGDVTDRVQLTPVAIREGQAFADSVFGKGGAVAVDHSCIPSAVFCHPPIAAVGMTESEARNRLGEVKVYQSDFRPMKNVLAGRNERSLFKMICDAEDGRIVGIHMIAPEAAEMMQAAAIAVKAGLTKADFDATVAIHPTMAEELVLMR
jgi:glutathione reductase (NADPH)